MAKAKGTCYVIGCGEISALHGHKKGAHQAILKYADGKLYLHLEIVIGDTHGRTSST